MSNLSSYISDLLFLHNCVIIPKLGGLVSNIQSAEIDMMREVVYPPHKTVVFNGALTADDGLLISYIANKQEISYSTASEWLEREVKDIKHILLTDGLFVLRGIGAFYLDANKKISFKTDLGKNYFGDSYGLTTVKLPGQFTLNLFKAKSFPVKNLEGFMVARKTMLRIAAVLLPIVGLVTLIPFSRSFFSTDSDTQSAGIAIKQNSEIVLPIDSTAGINNSGTKDIKIDELSTLNRQALYYNESEGHFVYHIIAGSYNDRKHAQILANELKREVSSVVVLHEGTKYRVSYQQFKDRYEALKQIDFLRKSTNKEFWLHKVKIE